MESQQITFSALSQIKLNASKPQNLFARADSGKRIIYKIVDGGTLIDSEGERGDKIVAGGTLSDSSSLAAIRGIELVPKSVGTVIVRAIAESHTNPLTRVEYAEAVYDLAFEITESKPPQATEQYDFASQYRKSLNSDYANLQKLAKISMGDVKDVHICLPENESYSLVTVDGIEMKIANKDVVQRFLNSSTAFMEADFAKKEADYASLPVVQPHLTQS